MDRDDFEQLGLRTAQWATTYLFDGQQPAYRPMSGKDHHAILDTVLPERGLPVEALLDWLEERVYPFPSPNNHRGSFAWITSPAAKEGILASWIAATLNAHCGVGDHAAHDVERLALAHLMDLVGFPREGSRGILTSGGSMANLICLAVARHWFANKAGWNGRTDGLQGIHHAPLVLYISRESHSSLSLAAQLLGIGEQFVQQIPTTPDARMDVTALRWQIEIDLAAGLQPWCVVSTVGSTPTGAIDPMVEIARVCSDFALWHHGDCAYGGFGIVVPELASHYLGMELLDSMTIDPHKMLCVPVGCGAALVRKGTLLRETFSLKPSYLHSSDEEPWLHEYTFELTRPFRALPFLVVLHVLGRAGVRRLIERYLQLAEYLASLVRQAEELELKTAGPLSIVCFRYAPIPLRENPTVLNALNTALVEQIQKSGNAFITGMYLEREFVLRACICNYLTEEQDVENLVHAACSLGHELSQLHAVW